VFASLSREQVRQIQPSFASKTSHQREADAWNGYLSLWRIFRHFLDLPQVTWLFHENGATCA
jgi:hypothetical protein